MAQLRRALDERRPPPPTTPSMRAPTTWERIGGGLQSAVESLSKQPLARIADLAGLVNLDAAKREFSEPYSGVRYATMPSGPFKWGNKTLELLDDTVGPRLNASGESMASSEALSRMSGMKDRGQKFVVRRGGMTRELIGPTAVDYNPRPGEEYGVLRDGVFSLLQRGGR